MPRNFARHEQFLRIFALLELLSAAHQPLDDQAVIAAIRERLGLTRLSPRTLRRDCEFLTSCGYAVDHVPRPDGRKYGWMLAKDGANGRRIPAERLDAAKRVFHVRGFDPRYAARPRLISTLSGAITDRHEIDVEEDGAAMPRRLHPHRIVIEPPVVRLLAFAADGQPVLIDIERIRKVTPLDTKFTPRDVRLEDVIG